MPTDLHGMYAIAQHPYLLVCNTQQEMNLCTSMSLAGRCRRFPLFWASEWG